MTTRTLDSRIAAALRRKIRLFYDHLNRSEFEWCYRAIDPRLRESPASVTLYQYITSLQRFLKWCGKVQVREIVDLQLHLNEHNRLYNDRDFALAELVWEDQAGAAHSFKERWVRNNGGRWYTRCTSLVTPDEP
jgi:hypothetical protein